MTIIDQKIQTGLEQLQAQGINRHMMSKILNVSPYQIACHLDNKPVPRGQTKSQVFDLLRTGLTMREIAEQLGCSYSSVYAHCRGAIATQTTEQLAAKRAQFRLIEAQIKAGRTTSDIAAELDIPAYKVRNRGAAIGMKVETVQNRRIALIPRLLAELDSNPSATVDEFIKQWPTLGKHVGSWGMALSKFNKRYEPFTGRLVANIRPPSNRQVLQSDLDAVIAELKQGATWCEVCSKRNWEMRGMKHQLELLGISSITGATLV